MKWNLVCPIALSVMVVSLTGVISCKKPGEAAKSDLGDAGYKMTSEDWFRATAANDATALKKFISSGFKTDLKNTAGDSALHVAAAAGAQNSADFLLARGLSIDVPGALSRTPLMSAVLADQTPMVRWLLRQGGNPTAKDQEGFMPLMLAVREGRNGSVIELAPYNRENLDSALLLAAVVGRADVIDSLTSYGASVYAKMDDGRTPLMVAAENGNMEAVKILLDIGASRYMTDPDGHTAVDIAISAGHPDIAAAISREPLPAELALESPETIAKSMDSFVDSSIAKPAPAGVLPGTDRVSPNSVHAQKAAVSIDGEMLSAPVSTENVPGGKPSLGHDSFPMPPLVMRHYRERDFPISVRSVDGGTATLTMEGATARKIKVRVGETIPGSRLSVVSLRRRMEDSKVNPGSQVQISVVDVRDLSTGATREWLAGNPAKAHDPVALVEDAATGRRYVAAPGQRFKASDGTTYHVSDVRPNQMVIENTTTGAVQTIPLRGPRG